MLLSDGKILVCNNKVCAGRNKIDLTKDTIYTHPSTKQCNYSVDLSQYLKSQTVRTGSYYSSLLGSSVWTVSDSAFTFRLPLSIPTDSAFYRYSVTNASYTLTSLCDWSDRVVITINSWFGDDTVIDWHTADSIMTNGKVLATKSGGNFYGCYAGTIATNATPYIWFNISGTKFSCKYGVELKAEFAADDITITKLVF